ncbi:hypothetical protein [Duganella aceris]|uniref:Uncharacterized protein n=1 Tax=Duganella aceris TaxID=2703883 RepID=A0ABX0FPE6_9BURK|nr:hypothetical protein [Duganella aceris]NGZ86405.1 hypothetical protein [Duganella aceris]
MPITKLMEGLPNQSMSQADFDQATGKYMADLPAWGTEANALAADVNAKQGAAADSAALAGTRATAAGAAAGAADDSADAAALSASAAHASEVAAAASAVASANSSAGVTASSTTPLTLTNGTKAFTVPAGKQFLGGVPMVAVSASTPAAKAFGVVASYVGTTLTLTITHVEGPAGTYADWNISPAGAQGGTGGTAGGQLTGALDEKKGTAPASSATPDIWGAGGNYVPITQTAAITGFPNAPQPGAKRTLRAEASFPITASATLDVHGGSTTINIGDELDVVADTVSVFRVTVRRNNGGGSGSPGRVVRVYKTSTVFTASVTGWHTIILEAASGSGAVAMAHNNDRAAASGSSTGGIVIKTFYAVAGDTFVLNLGSRGASVSLTGAAPGAVNGNDAADSTFVGGSVSLTAGGGKKGNATVGSTNSTVAAGAAGGTASGGDFNFPGSPSGTVTVTLTGSAISAAGASGGAAPPYKGVANKSGDVQVTSNGTGGVMAASGGAGVGGKSGDATAVNSTATSGGGGSDSASPNATTSSPGVGGAGVDPDFAGNLVAAPFNFTGAGSPSVAGGTSTGGGVSGAGSGALILSSGSSAATGIAALMGGTGGIACTTASSGAVLNSGTSNYAGGTGGVALASNTTVGATLISGNGGVALATIISP